MHNKKLYVPLKGNRRLYAWQHTLDISPSTLGYTSHSCTEIARLNHSCLQFSFRDKHNQNKKIIIGHL